MTTISPASPRTVGDHRHALPETPWNIHGRTHAGRMVEEAATVAAGRVAEAFTLDRAERRPLTEPEQRLARRVFGDTIDLSKVRFVVGADYNPIAATAFRNGNPAITLGDTVHFSPRSPHLVEGRLPDLTRTPEGIETLAHELNHVRQYQERGTAGVFARIGYEAATHGPSGAYKYWTRELRFEQETLEAQSQIVGDYARFRETGRLPVETVAGNERPITEAELCRWAAGSRTYGTR